MVATTATTQKITTHASSSFTSRGIGFELSEANVSHAPYNQLIIGFVDHVFTPAPTRPLPPVQEVEIGLIHSFTDSIGLTI